MIEEKVQEKEIVLDKAKVWIDEHGICCVQVTKNVEIDLDDVKLINDAENQLVSAEKSLLLVDMSRVISSTREAREYSAKSMQDFDVTALALIAKSSISQFLGNVFVNFNKPKFPTRLFVEWEKAVRWLKTFNGE